MDTRCRQRVALAHERDYIHLVLRRNTFISDRAGARMASNANALKRKRFAKGERGRVRRRTAAVGATAFVRRHARPGRTRWPDGTADSRPRQTRFALLRRGAVW